MHLVRAEGDPAERGRAIGRGFDAAIHASVEFYRGYFPHRGVGGAELERLARPFAHAAERSFPLLMEMLRGMAEGADVPLIDLFVPNAFEELEPLAPPLVGRSTPPRAIERCSDVTVVGPGVTLLGHNENWYAADAEGVGIVIEVPGDPNGVRIVSPTVACFLPSVGMNSAGAGVGVMSLRAADDGVGIPRVFVSRYALEASSRADAVSRTGIPGRSGGYAYSFALAGGGAFTIETSASRQVVLDGAGVHTNHYVAPELTAADADPSEGSRGRYERLAALVAQRPPSTPQDLMSVLADHDATPTAICTHADPADGDDAEAVLFSMVCDLEAGRMWVAAGNPCEAPYEEVELAGVI